MRSKVIHNLTLALICYFGFLAISIFITAGGFKYDHGLSFYGEHLRTLLPYSLGVIGCSAFMLRAAALLPGDSDPQRLLRVGIRAMAILLFLLLITPDNFGEFLNISHIIVAFCLFCGEMGLAAWIAYFWCRDGVVWSLLAVQLLAGLVAMFSELNLTRYLSESSLIFQLAFCLLLIRTLTIVVEEEDRSISS